VIPGTTAFDFFPVFAVSKQEDKIVISGQPDPRRRRCGVFELRLDEGVLRPIVETPECEWMNLSLSPDGEQAVGGTTSGVRLIDLKTGSMKVLTSQHGIAAWSPDGRWIGALQIGPWPKPAKTILIDPADPSHIRDLGGITDYELVWSPDSRYIMHTEWSLCGLTLETIDIKSGKRAKINSSKCHVGLNRIIGWLSNDLLR
jgi:hypothetical protein